MATTMLSNRWAGITLGAAIAFTPVVALASAMIIAGGAVSANTGEQLSQIAAPGCQEIETQDSFSMNCAPTLIPDTSDQLTEAEVAEPGFNSGHGGGH